MRLTRPEQRLMLQVVVADAATMRLPTDTGLAGLSAQVFSTDMPSRIPLPRWDCDAACVTQLGVKAAARFAGTMAGETYARPDASNYDQLPSAK